MLTHQERVARYEAMRREGRLLRGAWTKTETDGRERACWLAALSPEVAEACTSAACPAYVMPRWLANMTVRLDDNVSASGWASFAERFGRCAAGWIVLDDAAWNRINDEVKLATLAIAREAVSADECEVLALISAVAQMLRAGASYDDWTGVWCTGVEVRAAALSVARRVRVKESSRATAEPSFAASAEAVDSADLALIAAEVALSVGYSKAHSSGAVADAAAGAANAAALQAGPLRARLAEAAAWDRIAVVLFDAIDREISAAIGRDTAHVPRT